MEKKNTRRDFSRRSFIAGAAVAASAGLLASCAPQQETPEVEVEPVVELPETAIHYAICRGACNCQCWHKVHVRDGQVVRTTAADMPNPNYNGICTKGLVEVCRTYSADRLQYPMKRAEGAERGEGKFERISWDEALDIIATKWLEIKEKYGPGAFALYSGGGNTGALNGTCGLGSPGHRLRGIMGAAYVPMAVDAAWDAVKTFVLGVDDYQCGNDLTSLEAANTVICWGANPAHSNLQNLHWMLDARDRGAQYIVIDPAFGANASKADWYIPINSSTDGVLALGVLNVVLQAGKEDTEFIRARTNSPYLVKDSDSLFLRMSDLGVEPDAEGNDPVVVWDESSNAPSTIDDASMPALDGVTEVNGIPVKTVYTIIKEKAAEYDFATVEQLTGVPQKTVEELARVYTEDGPVTTWMVYGADHYVNGHYNYLCMLTLAIMTGNMAKRGAAIAQGCAAPYSLMNPTMNAPIAADGTPTPGWGPTYLPNQLNDIMETGMYNGEPADIKGFFIDGWGVFSTSSNRNKIIETFKKLEFIAVTDVWMTETATYADVLLPACGRYEEKDLVYTWGMCNNMYYQDKIIEPLYESKGSFEYISMLAEKLGVGEFYPDTEEEYVEMIIDSDAARERGLILENLKKGPVRQLPGDEYIFGENGIPTADGRAQLYKEFPFIDNPQFDATIDASKEHTVYWEPAQEVDINSAIREKYPYQAMNEHMKTRTHSQYFGIGQIQEYYPEPLARINPEDAEELGVQEGDYVRLYNDRGEVTLMVAISAGYPRKIVGVPRGFQGKEFKDGHFCNIANDTYNQVVANQPFNDQAVAIEKVS